MFALGGCCVRTRCRPGLQPRQIDVDRGFSPGATGHDLAFQLAHVASAAAWRRRLHRPEIVFPHDLLPSEAIRFHPCRYRRARSTANPARCDCSAVCANCVLLHAGSLSRACCWVTRGRGSHQFCLARQRSGYHFKREYRRPLWQEGYFDRVLRSDEPEIAVIRYIVSNPIRARIVETPQEYPFWGSQLYARAEILDAISRP